MSATAIKPKKPVSATLASMAAKPAETATTVSVPVPAVADATPFDWDSLPAARVVVYTRNTVSTVDVEAVTPQFVKVRVLDAYMKTVESLGAGVKEPVWIWQECGPSERVAEFLKLAKRYANFKGYTLRGKDNSNSPTEAAFCVKPKEFRAKKAA